MKLAAGPTRRISVDRAAMQRNPAEAPREPVLLVASADGVVAGWTAQVQGPSRLVYDPLHPREPGGTTVWIETDAAIELETEYQRA